MIPRIVAIMGSGETTPTMTRVHRMLLDRLGDEPANAVLLDTPYGFQENADDISARAITYFRDAVGQAVTLASLRTSDGDALERARSLARLHEANYVFSGPGSPTHALRQWAATEVPGMLATKLAEGGIVVFASAAALTLGRLTVPVYEIYKAGEAVRWLPGLDLLSAAGLPVAVIPHYDNAEGGTHDTRYCYLGERRLAMLEAEIPEDVFILGVDGHTALLLDLDRDLASVVGLGGATVRRRGRSQFFPAGAELSLDDLRSAGRLADAAEGAGWPVTGSSAPGSSTGAAGPGRPPGGRRHAKSPLREQVAAVEDTFAEALAAGDAGGAVRAVLELEASLVVWASDTTESSELDEARAALRSLIVRLGDAGRPSPQDTATAIEPFVAALVDLRSRARDAGDWEMADAIRDRLEPNGVALHDGPDGTTWDLLADRTSSGAG